MRSAARLAGQLDEKWTAVYVETPAAAAPARARSAARILQVVSLAEELGADTAILTGNDVCEAIVEYARDQNISTVVVGRSTPRRLRLERTMSDAIAAASDRFDVIEIGRGGRRRGAPVAAPTFKRRRAPAPARAPRSACATSGRALACARHHARR